MTGSRENRRGKNLSQVAGSKFALGADADTAAAVPAVTTTSLVMQLFQGYAVPRGPGGVSLPPTDLTRELPGPPPLPGCARARPYTREGHPRTEAVARTAEALEVRGARLTPPRHLLGVADVPAFPWWSQNSWQRFVVCLQK